MSSKLKNAIDAVKDQTSIRLAKVVNTNSASLEVAVLKATSHDKSPIDDRHVSEILKTISSNKLFAGIVARLIAKRLAKTKNWIVALKCLMLILRIFQDGDPYFPKEVLHSMNRRGKILNIPTFRDETSPDLCDYTAFVKSFAVYLEVRLDCFLTGKLQRRFTFKEKQLSHPRSHLLNQQPVRHMKPPILLDRISYWQQLLDKAIATKPTGSAKTNRLVLVSFHAIVRESFDLYMDTSEGLGLVLDGFFHLQHQSCVNAVEYCVKASKQFEDLLSFYDNCKSLGIGVISDYPSVKMIPQELIETLEEFLKDKESFPANEKSPHLVRLLTSATKDLSLPEAQSQTGSTSTLEDLMRQREEESVRLSTMRSSFSVENFSELSKTQFREQQEDPYHVAETGSNHSLPIDQDQNVSIDFISFDEWPTALSYSANDQSFFDNWAQAQQDHKQEHSSQNGATSNSYIDDWLIQQHHPEHEQASDDVANVHSCFDDWFKEDKNLEHASNQIVVHNGHSNFDDWFKEDEYLEHASNQIVVHNGHSNFDDWFKEDENLENASNQIVVHNGHSNFDDWLHENENPAQNWNDNGSNENWELVLVGATPQRPLQVQHLDNAIEPSSMANYLFDQRPIIPQRQYNPFLEDETFATTTIGNDNVSCFSDGLSMEPTFQDGEHDDPFALWPTIKASNNVSVDKQNVLHQQQHEMPPTFEAAPAFISQSPNGTTIAFRDGEHDDPFALWPTIKASNNVSVDKQNVLHQQQQWLQ